MPSLIAHSVKLFSRLYIRHTPRDQGHLVARLRRTMNNPPVPVLLPAGVRAQPWQDGGLAGDRLVVDKPEQVVLYLHGGGYVCGKTQTYFNLCGRLARALNAEVLLPDYRLAPEHRFPAPIEDAMASYEYLLRQGWRPEQISLAGDSAGGGLALGTLLALRDAGRPMPRCAVLLSPFADVRSQAPSVRGNDATDYMLSAAMLETGRGLYTSTPDEAEHPHASPALGDFTGLPPLFITVCDHECLLDDALAVEARAQAAGVPVTLLSRPGLFHVWPIFVPVLPEAREDLARIINFIRGAGRNAPLPRPGAPSAAASTKATPVKAASAKAAATKAIPARAAPSKAAAAPAEGTTKAPRTPGKAPAKKSSASTAPKTRKPTKAGGARKAVSVD